MEICKIQWTERDLVNELFLSKFYSLLLKYYKLLIAVILILNRLKKIEKR